MGEGKNLVGVDIGANSIKIVQLKESRKKLQVVGYGFAELPPQTIIDGHIMSAGVVTETLLKLFHDNKISQKEIAIGLYGQSVIVRKITVPMISHVMVLPGLLRQGKMPSIQWLENSFTFQMAVPRTAQ